MFPLHMNSRWELPPVSLDYMQETMECPQPPLLELDPEERGGCHSICTRGLSKRIMMERIWQGAALYTHWERVGGLQNAAVPLAGIPCPEKVLR